MQMAEYLKVSSKADTIANDLQANRIWKLVVNAFFVGNLLIWH